MSKVGQWFKRRFKELDLLEKYFPLLFTRWQAALWGGSVLAVAFGWHFITADWPYPVKVTACVTALFFAGYYVWRVDHIRLVPKFEVRNYITQSTDTIGGDGRKNGWSMYFQLLPKCLTEVNVEECRGLLTSIEMWDSLTSNWEVKESEVLFLQWSHGDSVTGHEPITLYSGAERRLNVFFVHSSGDHQIRPCVTPSPVRFITLFNQLPLMEVKAVKFKISVLAKDCPTVKLAMTVQLTNDPYKPHIDLELLA